MLAIIDARSPNECVRRLEQEFEVLLFQTSGIVMDAISGHPDVFLCPIDDQLIVAPNTPHSFLTVFESKGIPYTMGSTEVSQVKYGAVSYNARITKTAIVHHKKYTDPKIVSQASEREFIHVPQAFTGCSLAALNDDCFITSDRGIEKALRANDKQCLYVDPDTIRLPGLNHGLFGGCVGVINGKLYANGSINKHPFGSEVENFCQKHSIQVINLGSSNLFDGGGIMFIPLG